MTSRCLSFELNPLGKPYFSLPLCLYRILELPIVLGLALAMAFVDCSPPTWYLCYMRMRFLSFHVPKGALDLPVEMTPSGLGLYEKRVFGGLTKPGWYRGYWSYFCELINTY